MGETVAGRCVVNLLPREVVIRPFLHVGRVLKYKHLRLSNVYLLKLRSERSGQRQRTCLMAEIADLLVERENLRPISVDNARCPDFVVGGGVGPLDKHQIRLKVSSRKKCHKGTVVEKLPERNSFLLLLLLIAPLLIWESVFTICAYVGDFAT